MNTIYIHTIADSTIDNLYWMFHANKGSKSSVEGQLQIMLNRAGNQENYKVESLAYDGFTTKSLLQGDIIGAVLPGGITKENYLRKKSKTGKAVFIHPLKELRRKVKQHPNAIHYVILSVGGNDFRVNLHRPSRLLTSIPQIQERYLQIIDTIQKIDKNIRPILMFQYRTDARNNGPYGIYSILQQAIPLSSSSRSSRKTMVISILCLSILFLSAVGVISGIIGIIPATPIFVLTTALGLYLAYKKKVAKNNTTSTNNGITALGMLLQTFYQPILRYAKRYRLPILDLPNTFNPFDNLYSSEIEPNAKGSKLIARGITHIIRHHKFRSDQSKLYTTSSSRNIPYTGKVNNPAKWKIANPHQLA